MLVALVALACSPSTEGALGTGGAGGMIAAGMGPTGLANTVVSKGGCPGFAGDSVAHLTGPSLLLLGPEELARAEELAAEFFGRHLI